MKKLMFLLVLVFVCCYSFSQTTIVEYDYVAEGSYLSPHNNLLKSIVTANYSNERTEFTIYKWIRKNKTVSCYSIYIKLKEDEQGSTIVIPKGNDFKVKSKYLECINKLDKHQLSILLLISFDEIVKN